MSDRRVSLYKSIAYFLKNEIENETHSSEVIESLEVAKQCLESAFQFSTDVSEPVPDLLKVFEAGLKTTKSVPRVEPTEEAKAMAETLKNQGNHCMKENQFEEAVACYAKAIELSPYNAVYFCNRAAAYSRLDKQHKAIEDCQNALEIDSKYSKAYGRMGIAYSSLGDYAKAADAYRKGLELDPTNDNCQQNLALTEERLRESSQTNQTGGGLGGLDLNSILNIPAMQNIAAQWMQDQNTQNVIADLVRNTFNATGAAETNTANSGNSETSAAAAPSDVSNGTGETGSAGGTQVPPQSMDQFLRIGQQLAEQLRATNPQLVDQLRQSFQNTPPGNPQ